jgi:hypothetical protein
MYLEAKTKQDARRAFAASNVHFVRDLEVVNDGDVRALAEFARGQIKQGRKLCVFVAERVTR